MDVYGEHTGSDAPPSKSKGSFFDGSTVEPNIDHEAYKYIMFMFPSFDPDREFVCVTRQGKTDNWYTCATGNTEFERWTRNDGAAAWYVVGATIDGELNAKGTMAGRGRDNLVRYHFLMLDDIGDGEGSKAEPPPVDPACKLETSAGNYQWTYRLKPGDDFPSFVAVVELAAEKGWGDIGAGGEYRVSRLPRSANLKRGRKEFRTKVECVDTETIWDLIELGEALGFTRAEIAARAAQKASKTKGVTTSAVTTISGDTLDPVLTWLIDNGYARGESDARGFVPVQCPWHDQHTTGADTASYSPVGCGGEYEAHRAFNCFHAHCKDRDAKDYLDWVKGQGGPTAARHDRLTLVQGNYILVERGPQVVDLRERRAGREPLRDMNEFSTANFGKIEVTWSKNKTSIKEAFLTSYDTIRCKALTYVPTAKDTPIITAPDGAMLANMYLPPQWPKTTFEPSVFLSHVEYLLPNPSEREYFIGWLAHKIQNPGQRGVGIVMIAEETYGVGRSWLGDLLALMLPTEVRRTDIKQLAGGNGGGAATYNDLCVHKQFVVVDETQADDQRVNFKGYENIKLVVDTRPVEQRTNPKFEKVYDAELLFNLLAFSNNVDALNIPAGDRRFCILSNPTTPRDQDYYTRLYGSLDDDGFLAAVYWYLRRYDWSGINPRKPLATKAREVMIEVTKSPRDQITEALRDDDTMPDFMTHDQLAKKIRVAALKVTLHSQSRENIITHITRRLWAGMNDAPWKTEEEDKRFRPRINGERKHVRAWRVDAKWPNEGAGWEKILSHDAVGSVPSGFPEMGQPGG